MQKKLREVAEITSGYTFRGAIKNKPNSDFFVIQAKNVSSDTEIGPESTLSRVSQEGIRNPYFLKENDVLIVAKGSGPNSFKSSIFKLKNANVIASSSVHIIRPSDVIIIPKYLSLYLNSLEGQKSIMKIVTGGSYIQSILIKNLQELEIEIPPIHKQKSIIALHENIKAQEKILERKNQIKQNIINATFTNLVKK